MAATFVVNSTADTVDADPGDGVCADSEGACTLRAAVMEANALSGADTIDLTQITTPITLTRTGVDESYVEISGHKFKPVYNHDASIGDLNITDSVTLIGAGSGKTIIQWSASSQSSGTADRIFHIEAVNTDVVVSMSGLTLRNGFTPDVAVIGASPSIETLVVTPKPWEFARNGGCLAIGPSAGTRQVDATDLDSPYDSAPVSPTGFAVESVTLNDVQVMNCVSGNFGGGIFNTAPITISASAISGNTAVFHGGGIYNSATMSINTTTIGAMATNRAFSGNSAENGGGIFDTGLHTTNISASALVRNTAATGGALSAVSTDVDNIVNSTISGNIAADDAGGIWSDGDVNLTNVTVAGNQVAPVVSLAPAPEPPPAPNGAGLVPFASGGKGGVFTYVNTIITNNVIQGETPVVANCGFSGAGPDTKHLVSSGYNLENGDSCNLIATGDQKNVDPQLGALAKNGGPTETMALPKASPAVDTGSNAACPNDDQRGQIRPADGNLDGTLVCDIGAFELFSNTADLHIQSATAPDSVYTLDPIEMVVLVHNDPAATATATGVVITTSALPSSFNLSSATITTPGGTSSCAVAGGVVTCDAGDMPVGELATMDIQGTASAPGTLTVTATVSATAPVDPLPDNNTDTMRIRVVGRSDLGITASGPTTLTTTGSDLTMTFSVHNYGTDNATNVRAAAFLPDGLTYKSATISQGDCSYSSVDNSVLCTIGSLFNGATVNGTLVVRVDGDGAAATVFQVTANELDPQLLNNTDTVLSVLSGQADLKLAMAFDHRIIPELATDGVTLTVTNVGPHAPSRVLAQVTLPQGLMFDSAVDGSNCTTVANLYKPHHGIQEAKKDGSAVVECTWTGVAVNGSATARFMVTDVGAGQHVATGSVTSELTDPAPTNNYALDTLATSAGGSGGGCAYRPHSPFDPMLPALFFSALLGLLIRNRLRNGARRV